MRNWTLTRQWLWEQRWYLFMAILILCMRLLLFQQEKPQEQSKEYSKFYQQFNQTVQAKLKDPKALILVGSLSLIVFGGLAVGCILFCTWGIEFLRKPVSPDPKVPWSVWDVMRVAILAFFWGHGFFLFILLFYRFLGIKKLSDSFLMLSGTLWMDLLVLFFTFYVVIRQLKGSWRQLGLHFRYFLNHIVTGILGYFSALPILFVTLLVVLGTAQLLKYEPPPQPIQEIFFMEKEAHTLLIAMVLVVLLGPFFEELFFRGLLYNALKRWVSPMSALWITSIFFAAVHANLAGFFPILVLSALLTLLYEKTGSLISSITVHMIHNSLMIGFLFLVKSLGGL